MVLIVVIIFITPPPVLQRMMEGVCATTAVNKMNIVGGGAVRLWLSYMMD
jgi:hypothetical protein